MGVGVGQILTSVDEAAAVVDRGGLVVVPTETVYGIACKPGREPISRIFAAKQRPEERSIQLLVPGAEWLDRLAHPSADARMLAATFWPGPLTMVVWARAAAPPAVVWERTIGVRVPAHPMALDLLARCGPLAASSANLSGEPTPRTVHEIRDVFGDLVDAYLDGGPVEQSGSTVVDLTTDPPVLQREGPITVGMLRPVLGNRFEGA